MLTHLTQNDIHNLQSVGKDAQMARQRYILKDDEESVWKHVQTLNNGRVDFVLDNCITLPFAGKICNFANSCFSAAGFEVFAWNLVLPISY